MQILHLEDSTFDAELIGNVLRREWPDCVIRHVATAEAFSGAAFGILGQSPLGDVIVDGNRIRRDSEIRAATERSSASLVRRSPSLRKS